MSAPFMTVIIRGPAAEKDRAAENLDAEIKF